MSSLYASPDEFVRVATKFLEEASMEMILPDGTFAFPEVRKSPTGPRQLSHRSVPWDWSPVGQDNEVGLQHRYRNEKEDLSEPPFEYSYTFQKRNKQ